MNTPATRHTGPLGSTIHVLHADAGTIAELAAIDWNRHFRRVCLDPVRGVITLMAPSHPHAGNAPRRLDASEVLEGLTPDDVCEAVEKVGASPTRDEQTEAVARIVRRRRQQASVRLREPAAEYSAR